MAHDFLRSDAGLLSNLRGKVQSKEIDILMKDKTDFHKRLMLIAALKARTGGHRNEALQFLLKHDGIEADSLAGIE
ncbi:hypothetical protein [Candidatus Pantoea formicae]|uniref:hypothetical protein n=1 Tax=Candidatus Pantoea formicae TaxID=2608355 RepID=UPI003ED8AC44